MSILAAFGKGPGFVGFAFFCAAALFALTAYGIDVTPLTGPLGVVCGGLFAGGAAKAVGESWANGKNGVAPSASGLASLSGH